MVRLVYLIPTCALAPEWRRVPWNRTACVNGYKTAPYNPSRGRGFRTLVYYRPTQVGLGNRILSGLGQNIPVLLPSACIHRMSSI
jgi:hypothetical protein